jgi:HEAT repeat protein
MIIRRWTALFLALAIGAANASRAADPTNPAPPKAKTEEIDPDVLRKVKKLIQATLSSEEAEREKAWNQIKEMGNLAVPGLIGVFRQKTTTPEEVGSILLALGDSKDPRAGPALVELLTSSEKSVRVATARSMGDIEYKDGIPALLKLAQDAKEEEEVRLFAAASAGKMGSADAQKVLGELMKSTHPEIRSRAVFWLGKCGAVKEVAAIEGALADKDQSVREDAVEALLLLKNEVAWPGLLKAIEDEDYKVRNAAMDALRQLTGENIDKNPQAWLDWWKARKEKDNNKEKSKENKKKE